MVPGYSVPAQLDAVESSVDRSASRVKPAGTGMVMVAPWLTALLICDAKNPVSNPSFSLTEKLYVYSTFGITLVTPLDVEGVTRVTVDAVIVGEMVCHRTNSGLVVVTPSRVVVQVITFE